MIMHRTVLRMPLTLALLIISQGIFAQSIELTALAHYHFGGNIDVREGEVKIAAAESYGTALTIRTPTGFAIEVFWIRQDSRIDLKDRLGMTEKLFDASVEYINIGAVRELELDPFRPFLSLGLGAVVLSPQNSEISSETRMSASLTGGIKYFINNRLGIRAHTQLLLPFQWGGAGIFCGSGGCGGSVGGSTTIVQGTVGGGLILTLGNGD